MADFLIYGATGYTGSLIAHEAVRRGYRPILAGRNAVALAGLARKLELSAIGKASHECDSGWQIKRSFQLA